MRKQLLLALSLYVLMPGASAHHGFTPYYYQGRLIRIEGTIKQFDFVNPHSILHIESVNGAGETVVYVYEMQVPEEILDFMATAGRD